MTHAELVERAARWLRNTRRCGVVLTEASGDHEIPDAIGFRRMGHLSTLVECKVSRADFFRDQKKWHRRAGGRLGQERFYMVPEGLVRVDEVPEGWGLIEVRGQRVKVLRGVRCALLKQEITANETHLLYSALWKAQHKQPVIAWEGT